MPHDTPTILIEVGGAVLGLAILGRIASKAGFSAIPLYLIAGLAFGNGGLAPLELSASFISVGAEIGVLLLLFMLGLEYTGEQLKDSLQRGLPSGIIDFILNFPSGLIAGLLLGWQPLPAILLGGVTYISSSGIIAKLLVELDRMKHPATQTVLSILVLEDLAMAIYLPLVAVLLAGGDAQKIWLSIVIAIATVSVVLVVAVRYGNQISEFASHESDEIILLTTFGAVLLVGGLAQRLQISAAIGAFLVGIALSGPLAHRSQQLVAPLRDLFAAVFFFFFGLQIDPHALVPVLPLALALGVITALTKIATGYWAARRSRLDRRISLGAGLQLIARGEFSIVIAGLGTQLEPRLGTLSAAYVLVLALAAPVLARLIK
jgi:CPA2 family monovalent cation:H+ antiporter-2